MEARSTKKPKNIVIRPEVSKRIMWHTDNSLSGGIEDMHDLLYLKHGGNLFNRITDQILGSKAKDEYKQAAVVMLRDAFKAEGIVTESK